MAPTRRNRLVAQAVIPLEVPKDEDVEYIKHRRSEDQNGVREEIQEQIPKLTDRSTPHQILRFFVTFDQVRKHMQWTTGPRLYQRFHMHLDGTHLIAWEEQVSGVNETVNSFNLQSAAFKVSLLQGYKYLDQMDYLRTVRKSKEQSPKDFLRLVRAAETIACQLPDAPPLNSGFSEIERKRNFLQAMPIDWQVKFIEANLRIEEETINDMRIYFDRLQELHPFDTNVPNNDSTSSSNNPSRGHRNTRGGRRNNGNRSGNTNGNNGNRNSDDRRSNTNNRTDCIQNNDPCPLPGHAGHTWGKCRSNRFNPKVEGLDLKNGVVKIYGHEYFYVGQIGAICAKSEQS
jgi:hypothetical protein